MNEQNYRIVSEWIRKKEGRVRIFNIIYKALPLLVVISYGAMMLYAFLYMNKYEIIRVISVPLVTFILCTIIRYVINEERPYEVMNINPLIKKDKKGQSFPSRHTLSAVIIAMCGFYINTVMGSILMVISIIIAIIRPIAGVHYIKDVAAGLVMAIVCGIIGFWVI